MFNIGRSTHTAIFQFTKQILESLEDGTVPLGLFLDLSKAYVTLNHEILLRKLKLYGIRGTALKWIASYLSKRSQKVTVGKNNDRAWSNRSPREALLAHCFLLSM